MINRHVLEVPNRMDIETEFLDIIRQMGHEPSVSFIDVTEDVADENSARKLFYSRQYFVDSVIKHTVLRKKFQVFFGIFYGRSFLDVRVYSQMHKDEKNPPRVIVN